MKDLPTREIIDMQLESYERFSMDVMGEDIGDDFYDVLRAYADGRLTDRENIDYGKFYVLVRQWSKSITRDEARVLFDAALGFIIPIEGDER